MRFQFKKFLVLLLTSFCLFSSPQIIDYFTLPASASIEPTGSLSGDRSVSNLKDEAGNNWQIVLVEKNYGDSIDIFWRLVGFPLAEIDHSQPLQIATPNGNFLAIQDSSSPNSLAFNVAEYSVRDILSKLPVNDLNLTLDLTNEPEGYGLPNRPVNLKLPAAIVAQWQEFAQTKSRSDQEHIFSRPTIPFLLAIERFEQIGV